MPVMPSIKRSWFLLLVTLAVTIQSGCDEDSGRLVPVEPFEIVSLGSFVSDDQSNRGVILLEIEYDGTETTGEAVIRSRNRDKPYVHVYLKGTYEGSDIQLSLDKDMIPYQYELTIQATIESGAVLTGIFFHSLDSLEADFQSVILETGAATVDSLVDLEVTTLGLAFDGEDIWVSTSTSDYFRMNLDGSIEDTIVVLMRGDAHWTSDALTSDGTVLWGHYPVTINDGGEIRNESDIEEFTKDGVITRSFRIPHRTTGLAVDGDDLWSLTIDSDSLHRFDSLGTILESIEIQLPDLVDIEYEDGFFWSIGWFMKRLYKIDRNGGVLSVYHLPGEAGIVFPSGIVFDGEHFWYSFNTTYLDSRIYILNVELF